MSADEDLDGAPLEDLDGEPMAFGAVPNAVTQQQNAWSAPVPAAAPVTATAAAHAPLSFSMGSSASAAGSISSTAVSAAKVALFERGAPQRGLTPFQKKAAEAEERRRRAEEEAASEYAQFVASFDVGGGSTGPPGTGAAAARRGVPPSSVSGRGGRPGSSLLAHKAFVSGGVMGGDLPASASSAASLSAGAVVAPSLGGPPVAPGAKPMDPASLRAGMPSLAQGHRPSPFAFHGAASSPAFAAASAPASSASGAPAAFSLADEGADDSGAPSAKKRKTDKKRNIDAFLEELKQNAQDKAAGLLPVPYRDGGRGGPGGGGIGGGSGVDLGDPTTTNIYVGSLPPEISEKHLCELFAMYGDIASVKIMWPRGEDDLARRKQLCGFVSFMKREDAEIAMREMQNRTVDGVQLRLNWSRAVPLPATPYVLRTNLKDARAGKLRMPTADALESAATGESFVFPANAVKYQVVLPEEPALKALIDLLAAHVSEKGPALEEALLARATGSAPGSVPGSGTPAVAADPQLAFLAHPTSLEHLYYRWKVYSLAQGDTTKQWRTRPFQMLAGGPFILPPDWGKLEREDDARRLAREALREKKREAEREAARAERRKAERAAAGKSSNWDKSDESIRDRVDRGKLNEGAQQMLTELLRHVTMEKPQIRDVMGWCLDHSDASRDVVDIIAESLTLDHTPIPKKMARLYVVSDILYNSSAPIPNASSYRSLFQAHLVAIFASLHRVHSRPDMGRMSADAIRNKVQLLFRAWNGWALFPQPFLSKLQDTFEKGDPQADAANASGHAAPAPI